MWVSACNIETSSSGDSCSQPLISEEELKALKGRLSKAMDELANVQQDVSRLQIEKQEAEAAGTTTSANISLI